MQERFFSIIVVALNPGKKLEDTLNSVIRQTFTDYEIVVKDGMSTDRSLEKLEEGGFFSAHTQIRVEKKADTGIYDGMNQAVCLSRGKFLLFLNCGDYLYDDQVLERVSGYIQQKEKEGEAAGIYYGDQYNRLQITRVQSAPFINDFTCYRNVPCHQVCFYEKSLFVRRGYDQKYKIRADYEHFLYCIYERKVKAVHLPLLVASYEGGGFSETKANRKCSAVEHREIAINYLGRRKVRKYRLLMWISLAPIRRILAESPFFSKGYNRIKGWLYKQG